MEIGGRGERVRERRERQRECICERDRESERGIKERRVDSERDWNIEYSCG